MKKVALCVFALCLLGKLCAKNNEIANIKFSDLKKSYAVKEDGKKITLNGYGSFVEFDVTVKNSAEGVLVLSMMNDSENASGNNTAILKVECDGNYLNTQKILYSKDFKDVSVNRVISLDKGTHNFKLSAPNGGFTLTKISFVAALGDILQTIAHPPLVNPNATKETKQLYEYLCSLQGKAILSGQQVFDGNMEINVINETTGKYPVIMGIDLINYSPAFVERGATGNVIRRAKAWAKQGGIISCCWHWCAPKDLIDEDKLEMRWYDGYRTKATKFDFSKAIKDHSSEEYKLIIRDIDAIAVQLKALADANIPVLWRPLHEASGGWFWWGSKGSANYVELYKILYERLVNYHKLNNLIWVWNAQSDKWYPGDEYVDVLSYDTYPGKKIYGIFNSELQMIQSVTSKAKLCALSENGPLPDVNKLSQINGLWSWFCTWNGEFVIDGNGNFSEEYTDLKSFKSFYNNDYLITRDEIKLP